MIEDTNPYIAEQRDLTLEVIISDKPAYYRVSHKKSGLCFEAPTAREAVDTMNASLVP